MVPARRRKSSSVRLATWLAAVALAVGCATSVGQVTGSDPRVRFVAPSEGARFAPGDTVDITVVATVPLALVLLDVGLPGVGVVPLARDPDGVTYRGRFTIPEAYAGSRTLTISAVDAKGNPFESRGATIVVTPATGPLSLAPVQRDNYLNSVGAEARVYVTGNYAGGVTRDLSSAATGTLYESSDPRVLRVDAEGRVKAVGLGTASVKATNGGQQTLFVFVVEDAGNVLAPQDVTDHVRFERLPLELDAALSSSQKTAVYAQTVVVSNASGWPLVGPLHLTVRRLPKQGWLFGLSPGRPVYYMRLFPKDGITLYPEERVTVTLRFIALPAKTAPDYDVGVIRYRGDTQRLP